MVWFPKTCKKKIFLHDRTCWFRLCKPHPLVLTEPYPQGNPPSLFLALPRDWSGKWAHFVWHINTHTATIWNLQSPWNYSSSSSSHPASIFCRPIMKYHTGPCSLFLSRRLHCCNGAHLVSISTYMSSQRERTGVAGGGWKGKDWARWGKGVCWSRGCLDLEQRYYCRVIRVFNHLTEPICSHLDSRSTRVQMSRSACAWGGETRITVRERRGGKKIQSQKRMWKSVTHVEIREATSEVWFESRAQRAAALISWTRSPVWLCRGGGCLQSENMLFFLPTHQHMSSRHRLQPLTWARRRAAVVLRFFLGGFSLNYHNHRRLHLCTQSRPAGPLQTYWERSPAALPRKSGRGVKQNRMCAKCS